jgi:hypothetical protein
MISLYNYKSTTILRAFIQNSFVLAIITVFGIELRRQIDIEVYSKNLPNWLKIIITMIGTFLLSFLVFVLMRFCLHFGDGMLATIDYKTFF